MIASGSSERGLSEVTIAAVGEPRGDLAHQRALAAVAVAAGAETHDHAARASSAARGLQHVLERVGRVRVVDEHGEGLALVDRLEAARARAPALGSAAAIALERRRRARAPRPARRARWRR